MIEYLKDKYYWFKTYNKLNLFLKDKRRIYSFIWLSEKWEYMV